MHGIPLRYITCSNFRDLKLRDKNHLDLKGHLQIFWKVQMKIVLAFKKKKELRNSLFYKAEFLGGTLNIVLLYFNSLLNFFYTFSCFSQQSRYQLIFHPALELQWYFT